MKILAINQPLDNRGDEAAHRSLIRTLIKHFPKAEIVVLFVGAKEESIKQMQVISENVKYINIPFYKGSYKISRFALTFNCGKLLTLVHPQIRTISKYIKESDWILNCPGGICMGLFQNWQHLYWLWIAVLHKKKIAYYSRSFGPFPTKTIYNRSFKKISIDLLNSFDFISVRDAKTIEIAEKLNIKYIPSIDSAFLDTPEVDIPNEILNQIKSDNYIVFVPNSLTWHPAYFNADENIINSFYYSIIKILLEKYKDHKIVMLPQLFNLGEQGDEKYFLKLKRQMDSKDVIVIESKYSSDIQQAIIAKSKLIIGARYHSIVFGINNRVPFIALSYEHKIAGLLKSLNQENCMIDISALGFEKSNSDKLNKIEELLINIKKDEMVKNNAYKLALDCFNSFSKILK